MQNKLDKKSKLNRLISLLNGSLGFEILKPPAFHVAFFDGIFYQVENLKLSESEFNKWKEINIRDTDSLQVFEEKLTRLSDCEIVGGKNGAVILPKRTEQITVKPTDSNFFLSLLKDTSKDIETVKANVYNHFEPVVNELPERVVPAKIEREVRKQFHLPDAVKIQAKEVVKEEIAVMPTRKTSGLMSEYGITWGVSDPSLYNKANCSPLN